MGLEEDDDRGAGSTCGNTMDVEKQKDDGHGGVRLDASPSSGSKWVFLSFWPGHGPSGRTATPMSEGGGKAYKHTVDPYAGRLIGGGTRVSFLERITSHSFADAGV